MNIHEWAKEVEMTYIDNKLKMHIDLKIKRECKLDDIACYHDGKKHTECCYDCEKNTVCEGQCESFKNGISYEACVGES